MESDSEEDDQPIRPCRLRKGAKSRTKRRSYIEDSGSSTESYEETITNTPENANNSTANTKGTRSSERIQKKNSRIFSMPKKEDVWKKIATTPSPGKGLDQFKPRKIVNDFTKISSRYNYDPAYTDDEDSSLEGFIEDEEEVIDHDESESEEEKDSDDNESDNNDEHNDDEKKNSSLKTPKKKIIGRRKRIKQGDGNSQDTSDEETNSSKTDFEDDGDVQERQNIQSVSRKRNKSATVIDSDDSTNSETGGITGKRKVNRSVIESDSEPENDTQNTTQNVNLDENKNEPGDQTFKRSRNTSLDASKNIPDERFATETKVDSGQQGHNISQQGHNGIEQGHISEFSTDEELETKPLAEIIALLTPKSEKDENRDSQQTPCRLNNNFDVNNIKTEPAEYINSEGFNCSNIKTEPGLNMNFSRNVCKRSLDYGNNSNHQMLKVECCDSEGNVNNFSPSKKMKVNASQSANSDSETEESRSGNESDTSDSSTEDGSADSQTESSGSETDGSSSDKNESRAARQQKKQIEEKQRKFQQFLEARKKYTKLKLSKDKFNPDK